MISKLVERLAVGVARIVLGYVDRQKDKERPKLDPAIDKLSIDDMVKRARADMVARRKANRDL